MYLGRSYQLSFVDNQSNELLLEEGRFCLKRELIDKAGKEAVKKSFEAYYSAKGLKRITDRVDYYAPKVGVKVSSIKIKNMGYRWASYSQKGVLNFYWKCMMASPKNN